RRRLHARLHSRGGRIRHPRSSRRLADADDRPDAVDRVLRQSRLAGGLGGRHRAPARARRADHVLPALPGARAGAGAVMGQHKLSRFNIVSLVLGFAFLYIPILLLVIYSFNSSRLVTVWAGFST